MPERADNLNTGASAAARRVFADHGRGWEDGRYVYPVVSRRSRGLSVGVNLNPDTICNFDCVYCQVDKLEGAKPQAVDLDLLRDELGALLNTAVSGELWGHPRFAGVDPALQRVNDIAFSGDGEPTSAKSFPGAVRIAIEAKKRYGLDDAKLVLITNATLLDRPSVEAALSEMDEHRGEVWAKLDAGTEDYYKRVDRSAVPFKKVMSNILACGRRRPIVIQSLFMAMDGEPVTDEEFDAYADRVAELLDAGCQIKSVQLYTVARKPLEDYVAALDDTMMSELSERLRDRVPGLTVEWFGAGG